MVIERFEDGTELRFYFKKDWELAKNNSFKKEFCESAFKTYVCPSCKLEILVLKNSQRTGKCDRCSAPKWSEERRKKQSEIVLNRYKNATPEERRKLDEKTSNLGSKNGMYGKTIYSVWLEKYGKEEADRRMEELKKKRSNQYSKYTPEQKKEIDAKTSNFGSKNGMYGRSVYSVWLEKYGKEEADRRMEEMNKKKSLKSSGKNNPMYGKSPGHGSGTGISGWYKGWFFRSLRELTYVLKVLEPSGKPWKSIDGVVKYRIPYIDPEGKQRNYYPDFLVNEDTIVEIKPTKLQETPWNVLKFEAARNWCESQGLSYKVVDVNNLSGEEFDKLFFDKTITLMEKWYKKFYVYKNESNGAV